MHRASTSARALAVAATLALGLAACGGDDTEDAADAPSTAGETMDQSTDMMDDEMMSDDDMADSEMSDMADREMGSADGPRADDADVAELREGDLVLLDSAPAPFADATGEAHLGLDPSTWLTVDVAGLQPGTEVVGHLHAESCETSGGPHFKFDEDGSDVPPNEVHIAATADDTGAFTVSVTNDMVASDAMSVVVHAADGDTTKALCADLAG